MNLWMLKLTIDDSVEGEIDVAAVEGRCFYESEAMLVSILRCLLFPDLSLVFKICLIAH